MTKDKKRTGLKAFSLVLVLCGCVVFSQAQTSISANSVTVSTNQLKKLSDKNADLLSRNQSLQSNMQQLQEKVSDLNQINVSLQAQNQALLDRNYQMQQELDRLTQLLSGNKKAKALLQRQAPSFTTTLLKQSTQNLKCQNGNCQFPNAPITQQDQITPTQLSNIMNSPYVLPVSLIALIILIILLLILIFVSYHNIGGARQRVEAREESRTNADDLEAIAGENLAETKLDMARALIEMGEHRAAKEALMQVLKVGSHDQKKLARHLLDNPRFRS